MPQPDNSVIDALQRAASLHLTAIENYQAQQAHFDRWGYPKLAEQAAADAEEERGHVREVLGRLEYYDAQATYDHAAPSWPRHDYEGILAANMALEEMAAAAEKAGVLACRAVGDERSALVFADLLEGSEKSIKEIEATQRVIEQIGLDNYLSTKV
jgi:bacterioferritin